MRFKEEKWNELVQKMSVIFRLDRKETERLAGNPIAKLIGAIPFIAECRNPDRTAINHLSTYMIAKNPACKDDFSHNSADDSSLFSRLKPIDRFKGGVDSVITRGMNLLALIQLEDHMCDLESDRKVNKYNPILAGAWNYKECRNQLVSEISRVPCPEMDEVFAIKDIKGFWDVRDDRSV